MSYYNLYNLSITAQTENYFDSAVLARLSQARPATQSDQQLAVKRQDHFSDRLVSAPSGHYNHHLIKLILFGVAIKGIIMIIVISAGGYGYDQTSQYQSFDNLMECLQ